MFTGTANLDLSWVCLTSALVMLMQPGFCCLESGLVRAKNSINVAIKNLIDVCIAAIVFWLVGFGLMFGQSWNGLVGTSLWALEQASPQVLAFLFFQLVFCGTSTTIISGAIAERMQFKAYLVVALFVSGLVYPIFGHWAWNDTPGSEGWLKQLGFIDFSGSAVVHSVGGWFSLGALMVLGSRIGRFQSGAPAIYGCNIPLATLGVFLLWFGWYGFNAGSTLRMTGGVPLILLNTTFGAAAGALGALAVGRSTTNHVNVIHLLTGTVAGLVSVTAGCHLLPLWGAMVAGGIGGVLSVLAIYLLEYFQIDDAVAAIPVHAVGGGWGTLVVGLFGRAEFLSPGLTRWEQIGIQALGALAAFLWAFPMGMVVCYVLHRTIGLRVASLAEIKGLNFSEHGASTEVADLLQQMEKHRQRDHSRKAALAATDMEEGRISQENQWMLARAAEECSPGEALSNSGGGPEQCYRRIFENSMEGIFQTTPEGHYINANPALARIYGYDTVDELRSSISCIGSQIYVDPNRRQQFMQELEEDGYILDFVSEVYRCDGQRIWISESAQVVRDEQGRVQYYEGTVEDITISLQHAELQRLKQHAEAANEAKSTFLAKMSHEIRTPLNGVIGMLDLVSETPLSDQQQQFVQVGRTSASSLLSIINDVLDFSKIEAGKLELEHIEFDLSQLLDEVKGMFLHQAMTKSILLNCHAHRDVPTRLMGDPERLRQILLNLVSNALKYTDQGEINLVVERAPGQKCQTCWRFSVHDTGPGILPDKRQRLFQAFSQMSAADARTHGGTGLGLAICKQLVDLMQGQIGVESVYGEGSTFWFEVPLPASEPRTSEPRSHAMTTTVAPLSLSTEPMPKLQPMQVDLPSPVKPPKSVNGRPVVLIAEDNKINQMVLRELLNRAGYDCEIAGNGRIAFEAIQARAFDAVLADCGMPEMDGWELVAAVRDWEQRHQTVRPLPVIAVTASAVKGDREKCLAAGMSEYLTKPIDRQKMLAVLKDQIDAYRQVDPSSVEATAGTAPAQRPAIDLPTLAERCGEDQEFIRFMLGKFSERAQTDLRELQLLLVGKEYELLARKAHNLKGSCANISAIEAAHLAGDLCDAAQVQAAAECALQLDALDDALKKCRTWIHEYTASSSGGAGQPEAPDHNPQAEVLNQHKTVVAAEPLEA